MESKPYQLGIIVGRFQTLHLGHEDMILKAMELCEQVGVFVGSSQEHGTEKNPFSYDIREQMIKTVFPSGLAVFPLPDIGVGNNHKWGEYVLEQVISRCGRQPDLLVSGKEERRIDWFSGEAGKQIAELYIPKSIEISASQMRDFLLHDAQKEWQSYVNPQLYPLYSQYRSLVLQAQNHPETQSI